jgi:hypothetical protein
VAECNWHIALRVFFCFFFLPNVLTGAVTCRKIAPPSRSPHDTGTQAGTSIKFLFLTDRRPIYWHPTSPYLVLSLAYLSPSNLDPDIVCDRQFPPFPPAHPCSAVRWAMCHPETTDAWAVGVNNAHTAPHSAFLSEPYNTMDTFTITYKAVYLYMRTITVTLHKERNRMVFTPC